MSLNSKKYIQLSALSCQGLPVTDHSAFGRFIKHIDTFYLFVTIDYQLQWTLAIKQSNNPKWEDNLYFDTTMLENDKMSIQVFAKHRVGEDEMVGELKELINVSELFGDENTKVVKKFPLFKKNTSNEMHETGGSIELTMLRTNDVPANGPVSLGSLVGRADDAGSIVSKKGKKTRSLGKLLSGTSAGVGAVQASYDVYRPLLQNIAIIVKVVGDIAEIYPYAQMAWMTLSIPLKVIIAQNEKDKKILSLLGDMNDIYSLVIEKNLQELIKLEKHRTTIRLICQQTTECAWFITDYCSRNFGGRMVKTWTTNHSDIVDRYQQTFDKLKMRLLGEAAIDTGLTVHQILANTKETLLKVQEIDDLLRTSGMRYAENPYKPDPCLFGTRENIIQSILQWFFRPGPRVFWLSGVAGCGKSAVACSIAQRLDAQKRCISFFFNESNQTNAGPDRLFATISRNLAWVNESWRMSLGKVLRESVTPEYSLIEEQFKKFMLEPAASLENVGPMLIIIDALDESGTVQKRKSLLKVLKRLNELPSHFRFLITSRPDPDIVSALDSHDNEPRMSMRRCQLNDSDVSLTKRDIERYVKQSLAEITGLNRANIDVWTRKIVDRSGEIFQWAATACKHIAGDGQMGRSPQEKIAEVLSVSAFDGLDGLYMTMLDRLLSCERDELPSRRFQTIMGRVLYLREPFSMDNLSKLWYHDEDRDQVENILKYLSSVLNGVSQSGESVQPIHISFADFLRDEARSHKYWIDVTKENEKLTRALLREMELLLRFNICHLETSYKWNADVEDLQARVANNIPTHLGYACRYWVDHLVQTPVTPEWAKRVDSFMRSHLLFWFEALSLIGKFGLALDQLAALESWLAILNGFDELKQFVQDAARFGRAFAHVIQDSTPHLYLSVLPLIPRNSPVSKAYLSKYPGCLNILDNYKIAWPRAFLSIQNRSSVNTVAYSLDGKRIASGSSNGEVRIWDSNTGVLVAGPFRGHTNIVRSVGFSPNGKQVVSGSFDNTVRIWNVDTGEPAAEPFRGHDDWVNSVGFSPNGKQVVSGSSDNTVRIWNVDTGEPAAEPFRGHTKGVRSVVFSPNGKQVVSGSYDDTVWIWNVDTGEPVAEPFRGHTDSVTSVGFSPNGKQIVSGSWDNTVRIWNVDTGEPVAEPFRGHADSVTSVGFSPNGKQVVSGSFDKTVLIWNIDTGEPAAEPFRGHTDLVTSVGFSPNEKKIVSGSDDNTIRIWNVDAGKPTAEPIRGHTHFVTSVEFSPNGKQVVSGSYDDTVQIWNVDTGEPAAKPFRGHTNTVTSVGFSPNGKQVVSGSFDKTIRIWNVDTGEPTAKPFRGHTDWVRSVGFSPNGKQVVSGSDDNTVRIWNVDTGESAAEPFRGHTNWVRSVGFSPDGKQVVSGSDDNTVRIWNVNTGEPAAEPFRGHTNDVTSVGFSPNGKQVVSGSSDNTVCIWNVDTGELAAKPFRGHTSAVTSVGFSPDGKQAISSSYDGTVRIWDVDTGKPVAEPLRGHTSWATSVAFSSDGKKIVSGSGDNSIQIWQYTSDPMHRSSDLSNSDFDFLLSPAFLHGMERENGWIVSRGPNKELLFWIPEQFCPNIILPVNRLLIAMNSLCLDVRGYSHGSMWTQCYHL